MRMESRVVEADGVKDGFFCSVPDPDHEGYFVPYLFVILDEGRTLDEVRPNILAALEKGASSYALTLCLQAIADLTGDQSFSA